MDKERDHTKFIIQRFDNYISSANTKGNFLLAFNTFLCGGIVSNYRNLIILIEDLSKVWLLQLSLFSVFILGLITTALIIRAVYPFLKSGNSSKDKYHSLIFFNSIAEFKNDSAFLAEYQKQSDAQVDTDMARQAYQLSQALRSKYNILAWAMRLVYGELFLLLVILFIVSSC